jgi:hypothetical protein
MSDFVTHASDCATHNEPAFPAGECNCRAAARQISAASLRVGDDLFGAGRVTRVLPDGRWTPETVSVDVEGGARLTFDLDEEVTVRRG